MGRPAKVTKHSLVIALSRSLTVAQTARDLDVDRHTVYDAAKRFGVNFSTHLMRFSTPTPALAVSEQPALEPQTTGEQRVRPRGEILRPWLADYTGPYRGDTGRWKATTLLDRYARLRSM